MLSFRRHRSSEDGVALVAAIVLLIVAGLIVAGVMMVTMSSRDRGRDSTDTSIGAGAAEDGLRAYLAALNADSVGEHTGYDFTLSALTETVRESDPSAGWCASPATALCLVRNRDTAFANVDTRLVKAVDQVTVRRRVANGAYRFWQVLAVSAPRYGAMDGAAFASPGGAVVVYVRGWQGPADRTVANDVKPVVLRAVVRPSSFSDYQILTDGKIQMGTTTNISGRIHTNGLDQSFMDQFAALPNAITLPGTAVCTSSARISTAAGSIGTAGGSCADPSKQFAGTGESYSLLRTVSTAALVRSRCGQAQPVVVVCRNSPPAFRGPYIVTLRPNGMIDIAGYPSVDARNQRLAFPTSAGSFGAALMFDRSVEVRGRLGSGARASIFAMSNTSTIQSEVPSIRLVDPSGIGSDGTTTSSVGFVASGDVIADETRACPLNVRAALVAQGGMLSMTPALRGIGIAQPGACGSDAVVTGSITGHFPPYMTVGGVSGYTAGRRYDYDQNLYHNPPPYFPTATSWQLLTSTTADANCFTGGVAAPRLVDSLACR
ncbi:MAG: hypothetical protein JWM25_1245 [Thermoleophilia bacterium]|nr:hypothetical protein [Thermoleophilia bacterium]MCZ4496662.1 hypothetical protein [Thermoleophilia bacterium]